MTQILKTDLITGVEFMSANATPRRCCLRRQFEHSLTAECGCCSRTVVVIEATANTFFTGTQNKVTSKPQTWPRRHAVQPECVWNTTDRDRPDVRGGRVAARLPSMPAP